MQPDLISHPVTATSKQPVSVASVTKSIRNTMRQDAGVDGDAQRIGQLGWMIFLKLFDAKEEEYELFDAGYRSPIPDPLRWRSWAADDEGITGDDLLAFVDGTLFPVLKGGEVAQDDSVELLALDVSRPGGRLVRSVFEDAYNYMKSGTLLRQVANKLDEIDFTSSSDRHAFNDVYESVLRELQSAGDSGEYYTPRAVTRIMTELTDPTLGEVVLDPACGTGGFLVDAIEHLRRKGIDSVAERETLQRTIRGVEKKQLPHLLCTTNLVLHDVEVPDVTHGNTLARPYTSYGPADRVDVVLTNPPFGGTEEDGVENNFPQKYRTRETADLFMALVLRLLRNGGRAAVVLPDGFLFGEGVKTRLKEALFTEANLHTVVRLPNGVFAPYTSINTNLLFFEKGRPTEHVWFVEHPLPEGRRSYTKTRPITLAEFGYLRDWWTDRTPTDFAWKVPAQEIADGGYNLDRNHPAETETVDQRTTAEVLADLTAANDEIASMLSEIERSLSHA